MGEVIRVERRGKFIGWYVRYKDVDGRRKMRASHQPTRELARRYLLEVEGRVAREVIGIPEPAPPAPTLATIAERFLVDYSRPKIKDLGKYRLSAQTALRRALPHIGTLTVDVVQPADVAKLRDALTRRFAQNSVRLTLAFLGTMCSWAVKAGLARQNPFRGIELPARRDGIDYLTLEESRALLDAAEKHAAAGGLGESSLRACVVFALHTGLRKGELSALRWRDLDLDTGRLTVSRSFEGTPKSNKTRHLRLPDVVLPLLSDWLPRCPRTPEGLVFPRRRRDGTWGMVSDSSDMLGLPELLAQAGCRPIARAWHALRHTFASHYMMAGGNLLALSKILGHADIKMTMVYAHLSPDFLSSEMNRVKF